MHDEKPETDEDWIRYFQTDSVADAIECVKDFLNYLTKEELADLLRAVSAAANMRMN